MKNLKLEINLTFDCMDIHDFLDLAETSKNCLWDKLDELIKSKGIEYLEGYGIILEYYKYTGSLKDFILKIIDFKPSKIDKIIIIGHQLNNQNLDNDIKQVLIEKIKNIIEV